MACDTFLSTNETDAGFRWSYGVFLYFSLPTLLLPTELYGKHCHIVDAGIRGIEGLRRAFLYSILLADSPPPCLFSVRCIGSHTVSMALASLLGTRNKMSLPGIRCLSVIYM